MLEESMEGLRKSAEQLRFSLEKCAALTPPLSADNLESIEALTSRFEPPRVSWRLFGLSHAAMARSSILAW